MKRIPPANFPPLNSAHTPLAKRAARIVRFEPGSRWKLGPALVTVLGPLSSDRVLVRHAGDDRSEAVAASALEPADQFDTLGGKAFERYSQHAWAKALKEQAAVTGLLEQPGLSTAGDVARSLDISERQLRRKIQRFVALGTLEAFLPHRRGRQPGSTHLHPDLERLMRDEILHALKDSGDVGVDDLHPMLAASAVALGLRPPSRATVTRRLRQARRQSENLPASIGREIAYRTKPVRGSLSAEAPLNRVEMDHTVCDVHIVEPVSGCPIGRPVLTLMIDQATRVILGMALSLEAPSRLSVGLCLHHGVFPKQKWLQGLGLPEGCWPGFGLLRTLFTDNGSEFRTLSLRRAAQVYGIGLEYRPAGDPAAGGIIERAIGTFMGKLRLLPGASYSKTLGKKPRHADRQARLTLKELEQYLARQISVYHKTIHSTLGMPPLTAWERGWVINGIPHVPPLPDSAEHFLLNFLPGELRTVSREGVALFGLRYQSPALCALIARHVKRMIRFDPRDLSRVFVETATQYVPVGLTRHPGVPFSLWEWRELQAQRRHIGSTRDPQRIAEELHANRTVIHAKSASRAARRQAREALWRQAQPDIPTRSNILQSTPLEQTPRCRVEE